MAAMAVGAVVIIGVCGFVLYRHKKASGPHALREGKTVRAVLPSSPVIRPAGNIAEIFSKKIPCTHFAVL